MAIILGIDPGSRATGYGLLSLNGSQYQCMTSGCIKTNPALPFNERLYSIFSQIQLLVTEHQPTETCIESAFVNKNASSALKLGQTRGAIIAALASFNLPIAEYTPRQVKLALTGYGGAEKTQVQMMVIQLLKLKTAPQTLDASDALAIALCHAHSRKSALLTHQCV